MTESFLASIEDLYNALTEKEVWFPVVLVWCCRVECVGLQLVEAYTQCGAVIEPHKGGLFSILNGHISGEFLECVRPSKIVQKWRLKTWPDGK